MNHLFLHCLWVSSRWHFSPSLMGFSQFQPSNVNDVFVAWGEGRRRVGFIDLGK